MYKFSGFQINNLGQYDRCNDVTGTRYALVVLNYIPKVLIALCGPEVCTETDYQATYGSSPLSFPKESSDLSFKDYSLGSILMILLVILLSLIALVSTVYEYLGIEHESVHLVKYLQCFSLISNTKKLFISRTQEKSGQKDTLKILNGVRVMSISWIIYSHTLFIIYTKGVLTNYDTFQDNLAGFDMVIPLTGYFAVDTLF